MLLWFLFVVQNNRHRKRAQRQEGHTLCQGLSFNSDSGICQVGLSHYTLLDVQIKLCDSISNNIFCFPSVICLNTEIRAVQIHGMQQI